MGRAEVGENVLIVDSQKHIQGLSTADLLSQQGKKVEVIFPYINPGEEMENITRWALLRRLTAGGVKMTPNTMLKRIAGNTVVVVDTQTKTERTINNIDTVVLSYGGKSNNNLYQALDGKVSALYSAGDCRTVRKILWATNDGAQVGRGI